MARATMAMATPLRQAAEAGTAAAAPLQGAAAAAERRTTLLHLPPRRLRTRSTPLPAMAAVARQGSRE